MKNTDDEMKNYREAVERVTKFFRHIKEFIVSKTSKLNKNLNITNSTDTNMINLKIVITEKPKTIEEPKIPEIPNCVLKNDVQTFPNECCSLSNHEFSVYTNVESDEFKISNSDSTEKSCMINSVNIQSNGSKYVSMLFSNASEIEERDSKKTTRKSIVNGYFEFLTEKVLNGDATHLNTIQKIRLIAYKCVENKFFEVFIIVFIVLSSVALVSINIYLF